MADPAPWPVRSDRNLRVSVAGIWVGFVLCIGGWLVVLDGAPFAS